MTRPSAVTTAVVTVNAAFLQELKEVNLELWRLLATARQRFSASLSSESMVELLELLQDLRDQLALHFALEEAYGYFEDPLEVAPHLSAKAGKLRDEHQEIYTELCDLIDQAERMHYENQHQTLVIWIGPRFVSFDSRLKDHEARENELIMDAFDCDYGGGD